MSIEIVLEIDVNLKKQSLFQKNYERDTHSYTTSNLSAQGIEISKKGFTEIIT